MSTAEQIEYEDKVPEQVMAALLGITYRALQTRRSKGQIPEGVWNKVNGKIVDGDTTNGSKAFGYAHRGGSHRQLYPYPLHVERNKEVRNTPLSRDAKRD